MASGGSWNPYGTLPTAPARRSTPLARPYQETNASTQHSHLSPGNQTHQHAATGASGTTHSGKSGWSMSAMYPLDNTPPPPTPPVNPPAYSRSAAYSAFTASLSQSVTNTRPRINQGRNFLGTLPSAGSGARFAPLAADQRDLEQHRGSRDRNCIARSTTGALATYGSVPHVMTQLEHKSPLDTVPYREPPNNHPPHSEERVPARCNRHPPQQEHHSRRGEATRGERSRSRRRAGTHQHRTADDERSLAPDFGVRSAPELGLLMMQEQQLVEHATRSDQLSRRMVYDAYTWLVCSIEIMEVIECLSVARDGPKLSQPSKELLQRMLNNRDEREITMEEMTQRCNSFLLILAIQLADCNASIRDDINRQLLDVADAWQRTARMKVDSASSHFVKQLMVVLYGGQPEEMKTNVSERLGASWTPDGETMGSVMQCCQVGLHAGDGLEAEYRQDPGKETHLPEFRNDGAFT